MPRQASDAVFVRRAYLDFLGRLPTVAEAQEYVQAAEEDKRRALVDRLLQDDGFPRYWSLHWCDMLRVKSEFPINLWPNAVYGYQRRMHGFLSRNEPYDDFVRSLLTASGSNFRVPEVNFFRASADRSAAGIAAAVALSFMGLRYEAMSEADRQTLAGFFSGVRFKSTREWKEEVVYVQYLPEGRRLRRLDGRLADIAPGEDARAVFCDELLAAGNPYFSRALVNRVWHCFFGHGLVTPADDLAGGESINEPLLDFLARDFAASGHDVRRLCPSGRVVFSVLRRIRHRGRRPPGGKAFCVLSGSPLGRRGLGRCDRRPDRREEPLFERDSGAVYVCPGTEPDD